MNVFNFNHLYYFYLISKLDGVTAAAKYLNTSQSSLSIQIRNLEGEIGQKLFKKVGRKLVLTEVGREVYQFCRKSFSSFDEMFDQLNKKSNSMGLRIIIGVSDEIDRPFVTEVLARVIKRYPKIRRPLIQLVSLPTNKILNSLRASEVDILLTTNAFIDNSVEIIKELALPVGFFMAPDIRLDFKNINLDNILKDSEMGFVLMSGLTNLRLEVDSYLRKKRITPHCVFESNILASVVRATVDGLGGTIIPEAYARRELKAKRLVRINDKPLWKHRLLLLTEKDQLDKAKRDFAIKLSDAFHVEAIH